MTEALKVLAVLLFIWLVVTPALLLIALAVLLVAVEFFRLTGYPGVVAAVAAGVVVAFVIEGMPRGARR